jgi:hypothetical protein
MPHPDSQNVARVLVLVYNDTIHNFGAATDTGVAKVIMFIDVDVDVWSDSEDDEHPAPLPPPPSFEGFDTPEERKIGCDDANDQTGTEIRGGGGMVEKDDDDDDDDDEGVRPHVVPTHQDNHPTRYNVGDDHNNNNFIRFLRDMALVPNVVQLHYSLEGSGGGGAGEVQQEEGAREIEMDIEGHESRPPLPPIKTTSILVTIVPTTKARICINLIIYCSLLNRLENQIQHKTPTRSDAMGLGLRVDRRQNCQVTGETMGS